MVTDIGQLIPMGDFVKRKQGQKKRKHERELFNIVTAFDIETTTLHFPATDDTKHNDHSFMYIWQWQFGHDFTVVGRTWDEFTRITELIQEFAILNQQLYGLDDSPMLVTYVHNLAFEFQFLCGVYHFEDEEVFFRKPRKPLYCRMHNAIEFRCSYLHSNMSLDQFAKKMGAQTHKQSGSEFDYNKIRYPWTELTEKELLYCIDDVICLVQALENEMRKDGDTLRTLPLTSTGYVRRDCKKSIAPIRKTVIEPILPDEKQYRLLRKAFRGGNTHGNRFFAGKILKNVYSVDMTSCYPAQQLTKKFPMGRFVWMPTPVDFNKVLQFSMAGFAVVGQYQFRGLRLRNPREPIPYLPLAKCKATGFEVDNGRLLSADLCVTALTEIDLKIVLRQYLFDTIDVYSAMVASKDYLPAYYRNVVQQYYNSKTELKGVQSAVIDGLLLQGDDVEYYYMKQKNKLNSVYGMSAQDPVHQHIHFDCGAQEEYTAEDYNSQDCAKNLGKANFPYQWGVYTTAYARQALQQGIDLAGSKIVYCDTDSVKTWGKVNFDKLNKKRTQLAEKNGAYATDKNGVTHYVGVYEVDGQYKRFVHQGAKRYCAEVEKGGMVETHITVSGVTHKRNPETGIEYCVEELGGIENFKQGMLWVRAGGTMAVYNDKDNFDYTDPITGRVVHISRNVSIVDSTYELQYSMDYSKLLKRIMDNLEGFTLYAEEQKKRE